MPTVKKTKRALYLAVFLLLAALVSYTTYSLTVSGGFLFISLGLLSLAVNEDIISQEVDWRILVLGVASALGLYFQTQGYNFVGISLSILGASIIPLALVLFSKQKWMGWGDVLMAGWVGLIGGFPRAFLAIFFAFLAGALFGIITLTKGERHKAIAFGPFLMLGCLLALVFGGKIIAWYLTFI